MSELRKLVILKLLIPEIDSSAKEPASKFIRTGFFVWRYYDKILIIFELDCIIEIRVKLQVAF